MILQQGKMYITSKGCPVFYLGPCAAISGVHVWESQHNVNHDRPIKTEQIFTDKNGVRVIPNFIKNTFEVQFLTTVVEFDSSNPDHIEIRNAYNTRTNPLQQIELRTNSIKELKELAVSLNLSPEDCFDELITFKDLLKEFKNKSREEVKIKPENRVNFVNQVQDRLSHTANNDKKRAKINKCPGMPRFEGMTGTVLESRPTAMSHGQIKHRIKFEDGSENWFYPNEIEITRA